MSNVTGEEPVLVTAVPQLFYDVKALQPLTKETTPPFCIVRLTQVQAVRYGFGDASGSGFGAMFSGSGGEVLYRHCIWGSDAEGSSSNWKELTKLVESLELETTREGRLQGCKVFLFMDKLMAKAAFFQGTSSNECLFNLILRLRKLELEQQCLLHLMHACGCCDQDDWPRLRWTVLRKFN
jgi:hypothetical protein